MKRAIFAGSFDPVTVGHIDLIERGSKLFDELYVVIATNSSKSTKFTVAQRQQWLTESTKHLDNVKVVVVENALLARYAATISAQYLIRGVRQVTDFVYEETLAQANRSQNKQLETILLLSKPEYRYISSSLVRELILYHGAIQDLVPPVVFQDLYEKTHLS